MEIEIVHDNAWRKKLLKTVQHTYARAPFFEETYELVRQTILLDRMRIVDLAINGIQNICQYLGCDIDMVRASVIHPNSTSKGQQRIIDICKMEKADVYINPIGGMEIYSKSDFEIAGIKLQFLKTDKISYRQFSNSFVPGLSMIDVLMFNSKKQLVDLLEKYQWR